MKNKKISWKVDIPYPERFPSVCRAWISDEEKKPPYELKDEFEIGFMFGSICEGSVDWYEETENNSYTVFFDIPSPNLDSDDYEEEYDDENVTKM